MKEEIKEILKTLPRNQPNIMSNPYVESDVIKLLEEQELRKDNEFLEMFDCYQTLECFPLSIRIKVEEYFNKLRIKVKEK